MNMSGVDVIQEHIRQNYAGFGVNKQREVIRLLYEIAKREHCDFREVLSAAPVPPRSFPHLKNYLLKRRYPNLDSQERRSLSRVPALKIDSSLRAGFRKNRDIVPQCFYVEESVLETPLARRLQDLYPQARWSVIASYKEFIKHTKYDPRTFNRRLEEFFIVRENFDFFSACPCSNKSVACGYHVMNLGFGCAFECAYCYLQAYTNAPGIVLPANIEDFFKQFETYKQDIRLGSGQFTDSLVFDHLTGYSPRIIDFFRKHPKSTFEFKTKTDNIGLILKTKPAENILISWSLNPQTIIDTVEFDTASLEERLKAARECVRAGYRVAFHFDPIIYYEGWERDYERTVQQVFDFVDGRHIDGFSLGGLRMPNRLKQTIENRFPENAVLDGELIPGYDGKLRYSPRVREEIYSKMREWIRRRGGDIYVYLCMEERSLCAAAKAGPLKPFGRRGTRRED